MIGRTQADWRKVVFIVAWGVSMGSAAASAAGEPVTTTIPASGVEQTTTSARHIGMMHYPDVSATHIAFAYANDVWLVPREGGPAVPLASPPGQEMLPKFSPDGQTIAFVGNYDGNRDIYTMSIRGGVPARVTHHPDNEVLCDWTPDGRLMFYANSYATTPRQDQLFTVAASGGLPEQLPVPYGADAAMSPDGRRLAYLPYTRNFRTWKRYTGGAATDIWLFDLGDYSAEKITDWQGTDTLPMWFGETIYYLSDAGEAHRFNIWSYDTQTGRRRQITRFEDYDVKWPSIGPGPDRHGEIVFQYRFDLYLLDLSTDDTGRVDITVPGDRPAIRPKTMDVGESVRSSGISSTGKRAVVEARGDIWTLPAEKGVVRNLTRTDGQAERSPAWSPDGRWIAYFSDAGGEYDLHITQSDGKGETKKLTDLGPGFRFAPRWSPDSKHIVFTDYAGTILLHTLDTAQTKPVDRDRYADRPHMSWSHDSRWLAYTKSEANRLWSIWLYNLESGESTQVTSGMFWDTWPTFDRKGDYLYFASQRDFSSPIYDDNGQTFVYVQTDTLNLVPLREDVESPFAPKNDEEEWDQEEENDEQEGDQAESEGDDDGDDDDDDGDEKDDDADDEEDKEEEKPLEIDLEGFEQRVVKLPVESGAFFSLAVTDDHKLIYTRADAQGEPSIHLFDPADDEREEKTVLEGVGGFDISADGKKLLVRKGNQTAIVDAKPDQKIKKPISFDGMMATIDPRAEWRQIYHDGWRIYRDFFYDPNMHGVDWVGVRDRYERLLDDCVSREDLNFVLREVIAELNCGHTYLWSRGDVEEAPETTVGMLGVDFELDGGAYRIRRIFTGGPWDVDARGPLSQPGIDVKEGDYLLAVNGEAIDADKDPWAAFQGLANKVVKLTVSDQPAINDEAREVFVKLLSSEGDLRYRDWVERNRRYVEKNSGGRIGYIHVPNTGRDGQGELFRQFHGQKHKDALIVDERWNGGGQDPDRFVELLNRPVMSYRPSRHGEPRPTPEDAHHGPKCMLINGRAGSGGDLFPYYFRAAGVGKLIGTRTWGGVVGLSGNPGLIDGGFLSVPTVATYEVDGTWGMEGYGVEPDIEVIDDPTALAKGSEPQLDAAIEHLMEELERHPPSRPPIPPYPDRSGMGVTDADK